MEQINEQRDEEHLVCYRKRIYITRTSCGDAIAYWLHMNIGKRGVRRNCNPIFLFKMQNIRALSELELDGKWLGLGYCDQTAPEIDRIEL